MKKYIFLFIPILIVTFVYMGQETFRPGCDLSHKLSLKMSETTEQEWCNYRTKSIERSNEICEFGENPFNQPIDCRIDMCYNWEEEHYSQECK